MNRKTFLILFIGFLLELAAVYLLLKYYSAYGILLHFLIIAGVFYLEKTNSRIIDIYLFSTLFLGPFGALGSLALALYHSLSSAKGKSFIEWFNSIFPGRKTQLAEYIEEGLEHGRDWSATSYSIMPLKDIIALGNDEQKQRALSSISSNFHPHLLPALELALKDKSGVIRVMAATILAKINNRIHSIIMHMEQKLGFDKRPDALKKLAQYHDLYAFSGLLEKDKEDFHRAEALQYYLKYLVKNPFDSEAAQNVARLYSRQGKNKQVLEWLSQCREKNIFTDSMLMWQAESLFKLKNFAELRTLAKDNRLNLGRREIYPLSFVDAIELWGGHGG